MDGSFALSNSSYLVSGRLLLVQRLYGLTHYSWEATMGVATMTLNEQQFRVAAYSAPKLDDGSLWQ